MKINKILAIHLAATATLLVGCDMITEDDQKKEVKEVKKRYSRYQ